MSGLEAADVKQTLDSTRLTVTGVVKTVLTKYPVPRSTESEDAVIWADYAGSWWNDAEMTKRFEFNWQIEVPEALRTGCVFDRWTEEKDNTEIELNCLFKADEYGFFIYWQSEGKVGHLRLPCHLSGPDKGNGVTILTSPKYTHVFLFRFLSSQDGDVIELCQVSDIRAGGVPKVK